MSTQPPVTGIFDRLANRDDFLGFGYIGGRRDALDSIASGEWPAAAAADVDAADAAVLAHAAAKGWDEDALFDWANSKAGRWFADVALGSHDLPRAIGWYLK